MKSAATFILLLLLLGCPVWTLARRRSISFSVVFSGGTRLLVHAGERSADNDDHTHHHHQNKTEGPSVQLLSSFTHVAGSPPQLVCLLSGLQSPMQDVLWWVDNTVVTTAGADVTLRLEEGGAYSATSVWEVPKANWKSKSTYWCGTIQQQQVYRKKCSQHGA